MPYGATMGNLSKMDGHLPFSLYVKNTDKKQPLRMLFDEKEKSFLY